MRPPPCMRTGMLGEVVVTNSIESRASARRMATSGQRWICARAEGAGEEGEMAGRKVALGEGGVLMMCIIESRRGWYGAGGTNGGVNKPVSSCCCSCALCMFLRRINSARGASVSRVEEGTFTSPSKA